MDVSEWEFNFQTGSIYLLAVSYLFKDGMQYLLLIPYNFISDKSSHGMYPY